MATYRVPNPYDALPQLPVLRVTSETLADGETMPEAQRSKAMGIPGGQDVSPQLSWEPGPEGTETYVVTMFDPDAPTASGFWHWSVANIPASVTSLPLGACTGSNLSGLPEGANSLRNDAGFPGFVGASPPEGHGEHRYILAVHAVGGSIDLDGDRSCAYVGFTLFSRALARGYITPVFQH